MLLSPLKECASIGIHITGSPYNLSIFLDFYLDFDDFMSEKPPIIGLSESNENSESDESDASEDDDATYFFPHPSYFFIGLRHLNLIWNSPL